MEVGKSRWIILKSISKAAIFFIVFAVGIPLILGALAGLSSAQILTLITSTFILQAASPPVGLAMGLSTYAILTIMACFALGIVLAILEICNSLAASSTRVRRWIDSIEEKTRKYPQIQKYGPVTCIGIAWIPGVGLYGTPIIAWILKWKRFPAVFFTVCGFVIAAFFVIFFANRIQQVLQFAGNFGVILLAIVSMLALGLSINATRIPDLLKDRKSGYPRPCRKLSCRTSGGFFICKVPELFRWDSGWFHSCGLCSRIIDVTEACRNQQGKHPFCKRPGFNPHSCFDNLHTPRIPLYKSRDFRQSMEYASAPFRVHTCPPAGRAVFPEAETCFC